MPHHGRRCAPRQEHVRAGHPVQHLQPRPAARARPDRAHIRQEGDCRDQEQRDAARRRARVGGGEPRLQVQHPGGALERAADRRQRQHRAGAGRARFGHGNLRDVSDHACDVGVALPVRRVREGRRRGPPGRGRDRGLRVRDRRLLRRQVHRHHHLRPRLLAQAGGDRPRRDGRDSAGRGQRPARRPLHRPADQGGAGRSADRDVRQPRRCAEGGDGGVDHRGLLLRGDHRAQDRRDVQHGRRGADRRRARDLADPVPAAEIQRGLARAADRPEPDPTGRQALRLGSRDRDSRGASFPASRVACTR